MLLYLTYNHIEVTGVETEKASGFLKEDSLGQ